MVTQKDIAIKVGVSVNTVSCALRDSPRISRRVRQAVLKTAKEMGYTPNAAARALRIKKSKVLGVIVTDISNPVFGTMVKGIEKAASERDYSIIICNTDEDYVMEENAVTTMISKRVDGVIITPTQTETGTLDTLKRAQLPFVLMGRSFDNYPADNVVSDDFKGGMLAGEYLLKNGHKDIIYINGPEHISSSKKRAEGITAALRTENLCLKAVYSIMPDIKEGYSLMKEIISSSVDFSAIFCFDDYTAFGVIRAIREKGLRMPEDISVIGYDNTEFAEMYDNGLTSIDFNEYEIGVCAAELLMDILDKKDNKDISDADFAAPRNVILEPSLVIRGSVYNNSSSISDRYQTGTGDFEKLPPHK